MIALVLQSAGDIITNAYFMEAYKNPSSSMANTLLIGDYLMASKGVDISNLRKGDIIIFKFPGDMHQNYIKRIAALGGEKIRIVDKKVYVNDRPVPSPANILFADSTRVLRHNDNKRWVTNVNTWRNKGGYWENSGNRDNLPEMFVPDGMFFVLGDNRDNSVDSRYFGLVDPGLQLDEPGLYIFHGIRKTIVFAGSG